MNRLAARHQWPCVGQMSLSGSREDATPRKYQRLAAGCLELELLSQPPRGSINSLEQVRNNMLMLNRTIVFPRDLQRGSSLG